MEKFSDFSNKKTVNNSGDNAKNGEYKKVEDMFNKYSKLDKNSLMNEFINETMRQNRMAL